jgi:pilus assembly protein CpaC
MRSLVRLLLPLLIYTLSPLGASAEPPAAGPPVPMPSPVVYKVQAASQRLEMTVHTSRILSLDQKIPQAQVNNPDILEVTPLSPNQIQVSAKATGVTQINLWGEDQEMFTIDVLIIGDVRELEMLLRSTFPNAALKLTPVANSVLISGYVDQTGYIERIIHIAEEYYPKVINNMTVGGCQQVMLHVKVMEVSRTKLRRLGFDFSKVTGPSVLTSGPIGLLSNTLNGTNIVANGSGGTFSFGVVNGNNAFFGYLDALRQDNLLKILADPTLVTVSGRAASFNSGGEIPIPVPQSLGTISIEWKQYGTQIDFVPIVLGNGKIRLEVRPRISELDDSRAVNIQGTLVPGIKSREADTGVELMAGQTLAIAGLVQTRTESMNRGLPWISEVPYLGVAFRKTQETINEVELLMLVTPELVEAMDASETPLCGPGMQTTSPSDWELFMKGHLEVPNCCPTGYACNSECLPSGEDPDSLPPDGMIQGPGEKIPAPSPTGGVRTSGPRGRYSPSNRNASTAATPAATSSGPPGLIGPVGYDVVE